MATRYWVGGSGTWDATTTTNWSASSGGAGGASAPTSTDDVVFDSNAGAAPTVTIGTNAVCGAMTATAPTSGTLTFAFGSTGVISYNGNWSSPASLFATTGNGVTGGSIVYVGSGSSTLTTNGYSFPTSFGVNTSAGTLTLGSAFTATGISIFTFTRGTFSTSASNYSLTLYGLNSSNSNSRTINLNASTVTLNGASALDFTTTTNLTFNAGTSSIVCTASSAQFLCGGQTFYNVSFTQSGSSSPIITGANTFNNLSITGRTSLGINAFTFSANQIINGTLTLGAGTTPAYRTFLASDTIGTTRTLTVNALAAGTADIDFRDITIAGTAAPISGTRFGDCKGNSGITFSAAKTVYYGQTGSANWGSGSTGSWSLTSGGALDATAFPLAQDTAVFPAATYPASGSTTTINAVYNIGTIDMSARTSNTMTLALSVGASVYGNWLNGTGITLTGPTALTFCGRTSQTLTNAGRTFAQQIIVNSVGGSLTLQDALNSSSSNGITLTQGTFNAATYNVTLVGNVAAGGTGTRTLAIGSGTWSVNDAVWSTNAPTNLTLTGTGTVSLTSASAKIFSGGSVSYSGITLDNGGAGAITILGSNTFGNITNTYNVTGATSIKFSAGTTNTFANWNASGTAGKLLTITSDSAATHTLSKASGVVSADYLSLTNSIATGGATWYAGANSTNVSGNTGWVFTAFPVSVNTSNFFLMF